MTKHIMLDIETWGTGPKALIVSIGAVAFDKDAITDSFHVCIDPESAKATGGEIDPSTILWWMSSERTEPREKWLQAEKVDIWSALNGFRQWAEPILSVDGDNVRPGRVWGNGAAFDNVIVRSAMERLNIDCWPFWLDACYRTIKGSAVDIKLQRLGTYHDAVDDATSQAEHLIQINRFLGEAIL